MTSKRHKILVVTDKYPPHVVGGAELSLHMLLQSIRQDSCEFLIAVLDGRSAGDASSFEGIRTIGLASLGEWPPSQHDTFFARSVGPKWLTRRFVHKEMQLRYLLSGTASNLEGRIERLRNLRRISRDEAFNFVPSMDDDLVASRPTVLALNEVIENFDPDLIHADNYRSIIAVAHSKRNGRPFTAMVRDHRFFCAHKNQSANIGGKVCFDCQFGCVESPNASSKQIAQKLMAEIHDFRVRSLNLASEIVTTSEYLRDQIHRLLPGKTVRAIGNPVDDLRAPDQALKDVSQATPNELLIVGMINENKGQERVVDWINQLRSRLKDFRIVLAGRGRLSEKIIQQAEKHHVRDHLIPTGFLDRHAIYRAYARASVVIAPNRWPEPFGRVPLEAGLCERPIVAYRLGGIQESVVDGETGFLVEPSDERALLSRVVELVENPDRAVEMGKAARRLILRRYNLSQVADRLRDIWVQNISK